MFDKLGKLHIRNKLDEVIQDKLKEAENRKKNEAVKKFQSRRKNNSFFADFDENK